jgi:hypothetical protein
MPSATSVTVADGSSVRCEITNTYAPPPPDPAASLTLVKVVDNGTSGHAKPQDWTLTASGPALVQGAGGSDSVTNVVVPVGDYTLSESGGPSGYDSRGWVCTGGTLNSDVVTVVDESTVNCTVTNVSTTGGNVLPNETTSPNATSPGSGSSGGGSGSESTAGSGEALAATGDPAARVAAFGVALILIGGAGVWLAVRRHGRRS